LYIHTLQISVTYPQANQLLDQKITFLIAVQDEVFPYIKFKYHILEAEV